MDCIDELNYFQKRIFIEFYNKLFKYRNETVNTIFKYNETTLLSEFEFIQTFKCFYSFLDFNENSLIHNEYEYNILTIRILCLIVIFLFKCLFVIKEKLN